MMQLPYTGDAGRSQKEDEEDLQRSSCIKVCS
jgi:hypothetical protein